MQIMVDYLGKWCETWGLTVKLNEAKVMHFRAHSKQKIDGTCIDHIVFMRSFEQRIKDNFQQKCFSEINISNRCILYKAIHVNLKWQSIYYVCILIVIGKHCVGFVLAAIDYFEGLELKPTMSTFLCIEIIEF